MRNRFRTGSLSAGKYKPIGGQRASKKNDNRKTFHLPSCRKVSTCFEWKTIYTYYNKSHFSIDVSAEIHKCNKVLNIWGIPFYIKIQVLTLLSHASFTGFTYIQTLQNISDSCPCKMSLRCTKMYVCSREFLYKKDLNKIPLLHIFCSFMAGFENSCTLEVFQILNNHYETERKFALQRSLTIHISVALLTSLTRKIEGFKVMTSQYSYI